MSNIRTARELQEVLWRQGLPEIKVAADIGDRIRDFGKSIRKSPYLQAALGGAGGAALGGGIGALSAMGTPVDEEEEGGRRKAIMNAALKGALLGGTTGAALPLGSGLLSGKIRIDGSSGLSDAVNQRVYKFVMDIKGALAGGALGVRSFMHNTAPHLMRGHENLTVGKPNAAAAEMRGLKNGKPGIVKMLLGKPKMRAQLLRAGERAAIDEGFTGAGRTYFGPIGIPKSNTAAYLNRLGYWRGLAAVPLYATAGGLIQNIIEGDL